MEDNHTPNSDPNNDAQPTITRVSGMYQNYFLDYASYVILERAVPALNDGLKPVQRRLLHSLKEMDDGRYHKVANVIGHTMKYHPHGDASIGDALVQLGQKDLLIDPQGNWGNILTGDSAAAPRYIEARLTKFAHAVAYNHKITHWQSSYDGRGKEPINLPMKFPLLLAQGVEGIAVGLSTRILPHNFIELIDASIKILKGKNVELVPDFPTGGIADFSMYNNGSKGSRVRIRAKINQVDSKTLSITEIPFGTTTQSLIDSILKANDRGKIKIKKIEDNTAEFVEILIYLPTGLSPDKTIDALYAFTACETSVAPQAVVVHEDKPMFVGISDLLRLSTEHTLEMLRQELQVQLDELQEQWHFASLERVFIEKKIYRLIEDAETWEEVLDFIWEGLKPHIGHLLREVTENDIVRLTEIRIKRISKFDSNKADDQIQSLEGKIQGVKDKLAHLVDHAVNYFKELKEKFGKGRERKTEIRIFDDIVASKVAIANEKLYVNRAEGFIGTSLKKEEFVSDCSDIDDIIIFRKDGVMQVVKVGAKVYVGKDIVHIAVFKKGDKRTIYNMAYIDGATQVTYIKRFNVTSVTREREYDLTQGTKGTKMMYFTANPNGEAESVTAYFKPLAKLKKLRMDFDFMELAIKGRSSKGNILSKNPIKKIEIKEKGVSTLAPRKIWYDSTVKRLNADGRGRLLGSFRGEDVILTVMSSGHYKLVGFDLATHFDEDMIIIEKYDPNRALSIVYWEGSKSKYFVKRFIPELNLGKKELFISETEGSKLELASYHPVPEVEITFRKEKGKQREDELTNLVDFISVKGMKALGNQLTSYSVRKMILIEPKMPEPVTAEEVKEVLSNSDSFAAKEDNSMVPSPKESSEINPKTEDPNPGEPGEQASLF